MKTPSANAEKWKVIGGAVIVLAAAVVMFPGFLSVGIGLSRILLIIVLAGGVCLALAYGTRHLLKLKRGAGGEIPPASGSEQPLP